MQNMQASKRNILIIGAGKAGQLIYRDIVKNHPGNTVIGFIDFEGKGEEVFIQKNPTQDSKKHRIIMYKTCVDYTSQRYDYCTKKRGRI